MLGKQLLSGTWLLRVQAVLVGLPRGLAIDRHAATGRQAEDEIRSS